MESDEKKTLVGSVVVMSFVMLILGAIGMIICFLFMWSSSLLT